MATVKQQRELYDRLIQLFDLVENVIKAIESPKVRNRPAQLQLAEKFICTTGDGIESILNVYLRQVKRGGVPTQEDARAIEDAARKIFTDLIGLTSQLKQLKPAV